VKQNVRKQAIYDKLQGSVATHLRRGGAVNNQIKKGLLLSLSAKKTFEISEYLARTWLFPALCAPGHHTRESSIENTIF